MSPEQSLAVSALVVALTQLAKWSGLPNKYGPVAVLILAALATGLWAWDAEVMVRGNIFGLVSTAAQVAVGAAGIFGFTRTAAEAVTSVRTKTQDEPAGAEGYDVRCENCLRPIMTTLEKPEPFAELEEDAPDFCQHCGHKLMQPRVKRTGWIADRAD